MKKRTKKYNPKKHKVNVNAFAQVVQKNKPLTQEDKLYLKKQAVSALNAMQFGIELTTSDFTILCDMTNISLLLTEKDIGNDYIAELYEAREALQNSKQRYLKEGKLGFSALQISAVRKALEIHSAQIEICTFGEFCDAFDEQERRIKKGNFYKREGDLSLGEKND